MAKHIPGAFRRVLALATSVLLIAAQLVLPVAALAQDISMLPTVTRSGRHLRTEACRAPP